MQDPCHGKVGDRSPRCPRASKSRADALARLLPAAPGLAMRVPRPWHGPCIACSACNCCAEVLEVLARFLQATLPWVDPPRTGLAAPLPVISQRFELLDKCPTCIKIALQSPHVQFNDATPDCPL
jgi:hypothetical protein